MWEVEKVDEVLALFFLCYFGFFLKVNGGKVVGGGFIVWIWEGWDRKGQNE